MDSISADIAKKLLDCDFANLGKRVQADGKMNCTERAMWQAIGAARLELCGREVMRSPLWATSFISRREYRDASNAIARVALSLPPNVLEVSFVADIERVASLLTKAMK